MCEFVAVLSQVKYVHNLMSGAGYKLGRSPGGSKEFLRGRSVGKAHFEVGGTVLECVRWWLMCEGYLISERRKKQVADGEDKIPRTPRGHSGSTAGHGAS